MLIGYSPARVARPYQGLSAAVNLLVLILSLVVVCLIRGEYLDVVNGLFPDLNPGGLLPSCLVGGILFVAVTILNAIIVRRKINEIWMRK